MTDPDDKVRVQWERFLVDLPGFLRNKTLAGQWICYRDGLHCVGPDDDSVRRWALQRYGIDGGFVIAQVVEQRVIPSWEAGAFGAAIDAKAYAELQAENARLRAVIEDLPVCAYGPCLKKGIWDFSDTEHGLRVYCQQHAEDRARDIGDFVEHCAELVSYADALKKLGEQ